VQHYTRELDDEELQAVQQWLDELGKSTASG
jgi:hypothetical protein